MLITTLLVFITALLYASVGFGGGSTYTALLVILGAPYVVIPVISLVCNIIVVAGGTWRFHRQQLIPWQSVWPLFITSVPMAWLGGTIRIPETAFTVILALTLISAGIIMFVEPKTTIMGSRHIRSTLWLMPIIGASLGFIAGMIGIGGGIFLAPALTFLKWNTSKIIAGVCSSFILINSIAGLLGQYSKFGEVIEHSVALRYWPLFFGVLVGGQLGSFIGTKKLKSKHIKTLTAFLVFFVGLRLLLNEWTSA